MYDHEDESIQEGGLFGWMVIWLFITAIIGESLSWKLPIIEGKSEGAVLFIVVYIVGIFIPMLITGLTDCKQKQ